MSKAPPLPQNPPQRRLPLPPARSGRRGSKGAQGPQGAEASRERTGLEALQGQRGLGRAPQEGVPTLRQGLFHGEHKDRLSCGNCGYTTFVSKN